MKANALSLPSRGALSQSDAVVLALGLRLSARAPATLRKVLCLLCLVVAAVSSTLGGAIYVAPYDSTRPALIGTGTSTDPYRLFETAYSAAANGDTMRFSPGLHYGKLTLAKRLRLEKVSGTGTALIGSVNQAPHVDAGPDQVLTLGGAEWPAGRLAYVYPQAIVTDDYLPPHARYTTQWTKVSGPDSVVVDDMGIPTGWRFAFSGYGSYVFRVTVSDGDLSGSDELTIELQSSCLRTPVVEAGSQPVTPPGVLPAEYLLNASATLDGQTISADRPSWYWWQLSGPGTVIFGSRQSSQTSAWFPAFGIYRVAVRAVLDGNSSCAQTKTLTIVVSSGDDQPPAIIGPGQLTLVLGETQPLGEIQAACKTLPFTVTDDGKPSGVLRNAWSVRENRQNGLVTFSDPSLANPWVCINRKGDYVLRLTASDGASSLTNDLRVFVELPASRYLKFTEDGFLGGPWKMWVENTHATWSVTFRATLFENPWTMPGKPPQDVVMTLAPKEKRQLPDYDPHLVLKYCAYVSATQAAVESGAVQVRSILSLSDWEPTMEPGTPVLSLSKAGVPGPAGHAAQLELYGDFNYDYEIQTTTNFMDWVSIGTWLGGPVGIAISDDAAKQQLARFYRAVRR